MKKFFIFIIILSALITITSCRTKTYSRLSDISKDYCEFPIHSYWIYQDAATNAVDSVVLTAKNSDIRENGDANVLEEIITFQFTHFLRDTNFITDGKLESSYKTVQSSNDYYSCYLPTFDAINYFNYFAKYFVVQNVINSLEIFDGKTYSDTTFINNRYFNVIEFNRFSNGKTISVFFAKGIGIIRYEVDNKVINLIRYN